jgi:peptide/nickel transport system permease protein
LFYGGRTALLGPLIVGIASTALGTSLALLGAWRGGWLDALIARAFDLLFAFPGLLLAILAAATFGKGLLAATAALAISYTPYVGRVVRGAALAHLNKPYIVGLKATGFGGWHITVRHVIPNLRSLILSQSAVMFGYSMMDLAAISFLGLGVQQPTPDWGSMVAEGLPSVLSGFPQEALFASVLIVITVVAVNLLGERLGERERGLP